ncbi:DUF1254 domain-containing protein [Robertkochia solimangrovi]|uniref:DUF1254 domain-containing protein n=1 Tax=Robertkochia solimangrovi TaxID=2213046 RepID=UPI00117E8E6D|nr:DUF1254 domain-containing protein [Robertkochia solimangrovi]TRZ45711.1 hypothetical protein DMZ48_00060 [Robertkochia solimangrovi]
MKAINKALVRQLVLSLGTLFFILSCASQENSKSDEEILAIAQKAYVYGYPMILMDLTKKVSTNVISPTDDGYAPINQVANNRKFPDDKFTAVVKANTDTYYSTMWLDLKNEPLVLMVPETDRYYLLPMLDAYTNIFSVPGKRTTGTAAQNFLIAGPEWQGKTPSNMTLIQAPTNMVWILGRTQVNSPEDGATVVKTIQNGFQLVPLKSFGKHYTPPKGKIIDENKKIVPVKDIESMPITVYFNRMSELMVDNPPAVADSAIIREMASIGIIPGQKFRTNSFSKELKEKLTQIPEWVDQSFKKQVANNDPSILINGWSSLYRNESMGNYGTDYNFRALVSYVGIGANLRQDAVYPNTALDSDGNLLNARNTYIMHFDKKDIPPVNAFWSLTMYDSRNLLTSNPINRFSLGDRDQLQYNEDGSLDIYIQTENPGKDKESNWLPAPKEGNFELTMRLYWPKESVLNGEWAPVPVQKVERSTY